MVRRISLSHLLLTVSPISILLGGSSLAAEIDIKSHVDSVVIYPDSATVTRVIDVDVPEGVNDIVVHGLPSGIYPDSLRVDGVVAAKVSDAGLVLHDQPADTDIFVASVRARVSPTIEPRRDTEVEAKLKSLKISKAELQPQIGGLEAKKTAIETFSKSSHSAASTDSGSLDLEKLNATWDLIAKSLTDVETSLLAAHNRVDEIDQEIKALERGGDHAPSHVSSGADAVISVQAAKPVKGTMKLSYHVAGARWIPLYEAKLDTKSMPKPTLTFTRRAVITQATGEDWNDVTLELSTARSQGGVKSLDITSEKLSLLEPPTAVPSANFDDLDSMKKMVAPRLGAAPRQQNANMATAQVEVGSNITNHMPPVAQIAGGSNITGRMPPAPAMDGALKPAEIETTVDAESYQTSFRIPERVDIGGNGVDRNFRISSTSEPVVVVARATPAIDDKAYIEAKYLNSEDAPIIPGKIDLFRDGAYVGASRMDLTPPKESEDLGFGVDDRIKIVREPATQNESAPSLLGSNETRQIELLTTVKNLHPYNVTVVVADRVPFSETDAITVKQTQALPAPLPHDPRDKRGVVRWSLDIAPDEMKTINLGYQIQWPANKKLATYTE